MREKVVDLCLTISLRNQGEKVKNARIIYNFIAEKVKYLPSKDGETYLLEHPCIQDYIGAEFLGQNVSSSAKDVMKYHAQDEDKITSDEIFDFEKYLVRELFVKDPDYFDKL